MLTDNYPLTGGVGGIGSYTRTVAEHLAGQGADVHVFSMAGDDRLSLADVGGVTLWRCPAWGRRSEMPLRHAVDFTLRWRNDARKLNRFSLSTAVRLAGRRRRFDVLESPEFGALGDLCPRSAFHVLAVRLHGPSTKVLPPGRRPWTLDRSPERALALSADVVTVGSQYARDAIADHWGVPLRDAVVLPNPIVSRSPASWERVEPDSIVCVGRLDRLKGYETLVRAVAGISRSRTGVRVTFVGNDTPHESGQGTVADDIVGLARRLGIAERVTVRAPVHGEQLVELVQRHAVCVLPSLVETAPVAVMEALAWGVPVVTSDIPPFVEVSDGGRIFPVVPAGDDAALGAALGGLLSDPARARAQATFAWHYAQQWSPDVVVPRLVDTWLSAGRRGSGTSPQQ